MKNTRFLNLVVLTFVGLVLLSSCSKHSSPNFVYMPDMYYNPGVKYQEEGMRLPPEGSIPRNHQNVIGSLDLEGAGKELKNPLNRTLDVLKRGKQMYGVYCMVCHGPAGEGDGSVVPKFPRPPTLQSDKIKAYADGSLFYVISKGQNLMPSYASQIAIPDRWAIVHYLRALHRSQNPTDEDIKKTQSN